MTSKELFLKAHRARWVDHDIERAVAIYHEIVSKFPGSAEASRARRELAELETDKFKVDQVVHMTTSRKR